MQRLAATTSASRSLVATVDAACTAHPWSRWLVAAGLLAGMTTPIMGLGEGCIGDLNDDGVVDGADLAILLSGWGQPGPTDLNGSGTTDGADLSILLSAWGECPEPTLEVTLVPGSTSVVFTAGDQASLPFEVRVSGLSEPLLIAISQTASPAGLVIGNDLPGGALAVAADGVYVFNSLISAPSQGLFSLATLATWPGGDATTSVPVTVLEAPGVPALSPLSAEPGAVNGGRTTSVIFSIAVSGTTTYPARFDLRRTDSRGEPIGGVVAELRDDGVTPDLVAGDGVFAGTSEVTPEPDETGRFYRASEAAGAAGGGLVSGTLTLLVTPFPVGTSPSDPDAIVPDPEGGLIYSDQLFVSFVEGTSDARIAEIAAEFGGEIVGYVPAIAGYQMSIPGDGTAQGVLNVIAQ
ncbi:MAG: choice-of-anchor X domain-containing protein, partial [Phycisphaerales bacterium]